MILSIAAAVALSGCVVTDGDSLKCGQERVRLLGIDAPEMGRCRQGRVCAPGSGPASKAALAATIRNFRTVQIERVGRDRFGRTLGSAAQDGRGRMTPLRPHAQPGKPVIIEASRMVELHHEGKLAIVTGTVDPEEAQRIVEARDGE